MLVRLNDGIARIEYIQRYFPRVRIDSRLDRVPNVVGAFLEASHGKRRRIRMRERSRIAVHHPNQSAVVRYYKVRILIPLQEARQMPQSVLHLPVNHHAALAGEIAGENNVWLALGYRGSNLQKE